MALLDRLLARRLLQFLALLTAVITVSLLAIQPFTLNQLPYSADGLLQMYRAVALEHSLAADIVIWPRFSSGLVYGYGAPLFNYFPPLSYFPTTWLHRLGMDFVGSWLLTMVLYTLLAAWGILLLGRMWTRSHLAGWIAALAYIYAPYFLFDSVTRGTSPEVAALAALPFALLGFTRLAFHGQRRDFLIAVLAYAVFIPLHTLITLHGTVLLALYCLFLVWRAADRRAVFLRLLLAGGVAILLTAFYWLPALLETHAIKLDLITEQLSDIDVKRHLRPLTEILAAPHRADPTQLNQRIPISLGWLQLLLSGGGLLLSFRQDFRRFLPLMLFSGGIVVLLVFLNTPASAGVWDAFPLIAYTQFPWRLLGLASLMLALMTGIATWLIVCSLPAGRWRLITIGGVSALLLITAIPWTYTAYHGELLVRDIRDVQQLERESGQLALSSYAEYLPITADAQQLQPNRLQERFASADVIPRLSESDTLEILSQRWTGTSATLSLYSHQPQSLVFDWLYVPGWRADIDSREVAVNASVPAGLVTLQVPAGEIDLYVSLQPTGTQNLALIISALGVLGLLVVAAAWRYFAAVSAAERLPIASDRRAIVVVVVTSLAVFLIKTSLLNENDSVFKAARFGAPVAQPALANFGKTIDLLAVDLPQERLDQRRLTFKLYWRLHDTVVARDYSSIVRMRDPRGHVIAEAGSFAPGGLATRNWLSGSYVQDLITLEIPPYTPPLQQNYSFEVALFDAESLQELSVINSAGNPHGVAYQLGTRPYRPAEQNRLLSQETIPASAINDQSVAALYQEPLLPNTVTVGDELRFHWLWQKNGESNADLRARLVWIDEDSNTARFSKALALVPGYDFASWQLGEIYRGYHLVIVPPGLAAGSYLLGLQIVDENENLLGDVMALEQQMSVMVPPRQFAPPDLANALAAEWNNGIILHGYSMEGRGGLDLVWETQQTLAENLRLFVHLINDDDLIVAQSDGVPVDWTRPTTGWLPGEYVTTRHVFALPPGAYHVRVGWYRPVSGERIGLGNGDSLLLDQPLRID